MIISFDIDDELLDIVARINKVLRSHGLELLEVEQEPGGDAIQFELVEWTKTG